MALNYTWISLDTWDLSTMSFTLASNWDLNKGCTEGRCLKFQDFMSSKGHWVESQLHLDLSNLNLMDEDLMFNNISYVSWNNFSFMHSLDTTETEIIHQTNNFWSEPPSLFSLRLPLCPLHRLPHAVAEDTSQTQQCLGCVQHVWMGFYLSIVECVHRFELVHRYTPRHLAEYLPIIVMYPPKIVEKSDLLLKSLESLEPWKCWHVTT